MEKDVKKQEMLATEETGSTRWHRVNRELSMAKQRQQDMNTEGDKAFTVQEYEKVVAKGKFNPETGKDDPLVDMRRLSPDEKSLFVQMQADKLIGDFDVAKSGMVGSGFLAVGTVALTATDGASAGNTSKIMAVRALAAMMDTTPFNTQSTKVGYVPVQMSVDQLQTRFASIRNVMAPVRSKIRKLRSKVSKEKLDARDVDRIESIILAAVETGDMTHLDALTELTPKEKAAVKSYRHKMMDRRLDLSAPSLMQQNRTDRLVNPPQPRCGLCLASRSCWTASSWMSRLTWTRLSEMFDLLWFRTNLSSSRV